MSRRLDEYLRVKEAAVLLGISADTLRNWDRADRLKPLRHPINGYRLYRRSELETFLREVEGGERRGRRMSILPESAPLPQASESTSPSTPTIPHGPRVV